MVQPTDQASSFQYVTSATVRPDVQFPGPVGQSVNSKMTLPPVYLTGNARSQDQDSDGEQYSALTSPTQPTEEEGEVSDWESARPKQDLNQEVSEEQTSQ